MAAGNRNKSLRPGFGVPILDRYIFTEFAVAFFAVMAFCALLLLVANIFTKLQDILSNNVPWKDIIAYFACSLPFQVMQAVPMASMLAVLFSIGALARSNEILAMMTSGVHSLRIALPVVVGGILIAIASLYMNEKVVPPLQAKADRYESLLKGKEEEKRTQRNVFARGGESRFYIADYNARKRMMMNAHILDMTTNSAGIKRRIEATTAVMTLNDNKARRSEWLANNPRIWTFDDAGHIESYKEYPGQLTIYLEDDLADLLAQEKEPETMNYMELRRYVQLLAERKQPVQKYETDLLQKVTFPAGILIIMLIGFSAAVRARGATAMKAFGQGVSWAFLYYLLTAIMKALGHSGTVSPAVAGFLPIAAFLYAAVHSLRKSYRWYS